MAFNIEKARQHANTTSRVTTTGGGFDINKARQIASGGGASQPATPLDFSSALSSVRQRTKEKRQVRLPFSQEKADLGGGPIVRGAANIFLRSIEDIFVGGAKVLAQATGKDVKTPFSVTSEPFLSNGEPVTQSTFKPMSESALSRIEQLDKERPNKRRLNLIQGTTEEVFLPLLNAVDIVGLSSLVTRFARKGTLSAPARRSLEQLNMGLLDDVSDEGIRTHVQGQMRDNLTQLEKGKITEEQFIKRQDDIGEALDTLIDSPRTRFGKLGERTNRITTALEANRQIGKSVADKPLDVARGSVSTSEAGQRFADIMAKRVDDAVEAKKVDEAPQVRQTEEIPATIKVTDDIPEELATEARKYKSAEEFVEAQGTPMYTGTASDVSKLEPRVGNLSRGLGIKEPAIYLTSDPNIAQRYANVAGERPIGIGEDFKNIDGKVEDVFLKPNLKIKTIDIKTPMKTYEDGRDLADKMKGAKAEGYDGIKYSESGADTVAVFSSDSVQTKSQLTDIYNRANKKDVTPPTAKKPTPEKKVSKLGSRINEILPEGSKIDEFYDVKTISGELEKAAKAIEKNPTKALADALNPEKAMSGRAAKLMEFAQSAKERGDVSIQSALLSKMRVLGTEIAQGLNMFKAFGLRNPETDFMEQVVNARLRKVAITDEDIARAGTPNRAYNEKIYKPVRSEIESIKRKAFKVEDAQKLFDDLVC